MQTIREWANRLSLWGEWVSVVGVIIMVAITCIDVIGAKLFLLPVPGYIEVVSLIQVATVVFAVAATQRYGGISVSKCSLPNFRKESEPSSKPLSACYAW